MKKILFSSICLIVVLLTSGCVNEKKVLKTELDKRYDNYEIIESTRYWNTGGDNYVDGIVKINNSLYEIIVDLSGETNEYYESLAEEIDLNVNINNKNYSSNNNLIFMKLSFNNAYTINEPHLLLFIENDSSLEFYDNLYQLLEKFNNEYKSETDYPGIQVFFTDNINYTKKEDYKLFLLLNRLSWNDNERTRNLYKELNINNYFTFNRSYTDDNTKRLNLLKQDIQYLKESYEQGMLYEDYVYKKEMGNY